MIWIRAERRVVHAGAAGRNRAQVVDVASCNAKNSTENDICLKDVKRQLSSLFPVKRHHGRDGTDREHMPGECLAGGAGWNPPFFGSMRCGRVHSLLYT